MDAERTMNIEEQNDIQKQALHLLETAGRYEKRDPFSFVKIYDDGKIIITGILGNQQSKRFDEMMIEVNLKPQVESDKEYWAVAFGLPLNGIQDDETIETTLVWYSKRDDDDRWLAKICRPGKWMSYLRGCYIEDDHRRSQLIEMSNLARVNDQSLFEDS